MNFPEPVISQAIEPKTKDASEKLSLALQRLAAEDPTFKYYTDEETGQTIIAGMGELHLDIIVDRLRREFKVEVTVGAPQVSYRETITKTADVEGMHKNNLVVKVNMDTFELNMNQTQMEDLYLLTKSLVVRFLKNI